MLRFLRRLLPQPPRLRVLLLGLDGAGKSDLCRALPGSGLGRLAGRPRPDHHVLHHEFALDGLALDLVDPCYAAAGSPEGGPRGIRRAGLMLWDELLRSQPDAVVFLVDAADRERLADSWNIYIYIYMYIYIYIYIYSYSYIPIQPYI